MVVLFFLYLLFVFFCVATLTNCRPMGNVDGKSKLISDLLVLPKDPSVYSIRVPYECTTFKYTFFYIITRPHNQEGSNTRIRLIQFLYLCLDRGSECLRILNLELVKIFVPTVTFSTFTFRCIINEVTEIHMCL